VLYGGVVGASAGSADDPSSGKRIQGFKGAPVSIYLRHHRDPLFSSYDVSETLAKFSQRLELFVEPLAAGGVHRCQFFGQCCRWPAPRRRVRNPPVPIFPV